MLTKNDSNLSPEDIENFKNQIKDYSIGRAKLMEICLLDTELAKFGIDIDSSRSRYLLLVNDICDIALMNEAVAQHILENVKLQNNRRLQRGFSQIICMHYPELAAKLFLANGVILPTYGEMFDIITHLPFLVNELIANQRFINLINKSQILIDLALLNEEIALKIFDNNKKFSKFDKYWFITSVGLKFEKIAIGILKDKSFINELTNEDIFELGKLYKQAAKIICEDHQLISKLDENQLAILYEKSSGKASFILFANTDSKSRFSCLPREITLEIASYCQMWCMALGSLPV